MIRFFIILFLLSINSLAQTNHIRLWLSANDSTVLTDSIHKVNFWYNSLDTSIFAKQEDSNYQPQLIQNITEINNKNSIYFENNYLTLSDSTLPLDSFNYVIILLKPLHASSFGMFISKGYSGDGCFTLADNPYNNMIRFYIDNLAVTTTIETQPKWMILTTQLNKQAHQIIFYVNSQLAFERSGNDLLGDNNTKWQLGAASGPGYFYKGYMSEIVFLNNQANDTDRINVEQIIRDKYAPPVDLPDSINISSTFCPTTLDAGDRFTSYLWSTGDTTQTIQVNRTGTYSVTVTDIFGFQSSDSVYVQYPEPNQPFADTILCYGDTLTWDLELDSTLYSFSWSDGDTTQATNIYAPGGDYYCTITDTAGCQIITDTVTVQTDSFPVQPLFASSDTSICAGTNLYPARQDIFNTLWNTGDTTLYLTVQDSGTYTLDADDINGCHTTDSINISIHGTAPLIDFSWENHCQGDTTFFTNNSQVQDTSTFTAFVWQIDTLQTDMVFQTSVVFPDTITYQITLEGYTSSNCYNIASKQVKIYPNPQVSFSPPHICQHEQITIPPQVNSPYQIQSYTWLLDNTEAFYTQSFSYVFDSAASHTLAVSIADENGCTDVYAGEIQVLPTPVANFYTTNQCQHIPVIFHDSTVTEFYNPVVSSLWNISGNNLEGNSVSYTFDSSGYFTVHHLVTAVNGCKDTATETVRIYPHPAMQIADTIFLCANTKDTLTAQLPDSVLPVTYHWSIDSATYSNECCPQVLFTSTGYHKLEVTATTTHNCTDTAQSVIDVLPQPDAGFRIYLGTYPAEDNYLWADATYRAVATDSSYPHYFWSSYQFDFAEFENLEAGQETTFRTSSENGMIVLRVVDQNGCADTSYFTYHTYMPTVNPDFEILSLSYTRKGDFIFPVVTIKNTGNSPASPFITCELKGSGKIMEQTDSTIYPENIYTYRFRSGIEQIRQPLVLCSYIVYPWLNDYNRNSEKCISDESELVKLLQVYPQPAGNELNIDMIFNIGSGNIYFYFINNSGKRTAYYSKSISNGYNHFTFDISTLPSGEYFIKITAGSQTITRKFVKR